MNAPTRTIRRRGASCGRQACLPQSHPDLPRRSPRLPPSRQGTRWLDILKTLACYRLIDPDSEWRLHRQWYEHSALGDLLGSERAIADDTLCRCLDKLLAHKQACKFWPHLTEILETFDGDSGDT